jgi:hypothetical protein
MANYAESFVSSDSAKHIPYVWGGKQLNQPTEWSTPPSANQNGCSARIGLDCSGFVGLVLNHFGVRPNVAEVSVEGLVNIDNWQHVKSEGHDVLYFLSPKAENLLPGDILIFMDNVGNLVHTGIFYSQQAKFPSGTQPGFINSIGHSKCADNYAQEANGKLTGVVLSPFGPMTQARTFAAIRFTAPLYARFTIDGRDYVDNPAGTLDTTSHDFSLYASIYDSSKKVSANFTFRAVGVTGKGTYTIPEISYDSSNKFSEFSAVSDSVLSNSDSLRFYATTPPHWWGGSNPPATGGQLKIESLARGDGDGYFGTVAGTFSFKGNAFWYRYEDSTYYQDTVKVTTRVQKYYVRQQQVTGRFEGRMVLE